MKIGFIGLGRMGAAIARNLVQAGHTLTVYNRSRDKAEPLAELGAKVAQTPSEAADGAQAVFTMLADDKAVSGVVEQIAGALGKETIHIGSSTVSVDLARRLAAGYASQGQRYISAPVFGRPDAAENKRLVIVASGKEADVATCMPLFEAVGRQTFVAGTEPWHANAIKLCGNFMIASMLESFGEVFATLRKGGVDPHRFLQVFAEVFGAPILTNYGKQIADEAYHVPGGGFQLQLGLKDVRLVAQFAESVQSPMPLASLLRDHFLSAVANGQAELDWSSLALVLARGAGLRTKGVSA